MGALPAPTPPNGTIKLFDDRAAAVEAERAIATHYNHHQLNGAWGTAIGREWADRTHPTCGGLCSPDECTFSGGFCLVWVPRLVPESLCRDFAKRREAP